MASTTKKDDPLADVRPYLDGVAKSLTDRLFGPTGPPLGTSLSSIEEAIDSIRSSLGERILHLTLSRQSSACSDAPDDFSFCPSCRNPTHARDPEPRSVSTSVGQANWLEPHFFCRKCRKAFFPSVQESRSRSR